MDFLPNHSDGYDSRYGPRKVANTNVALEQTPTGNVTMLCGFCSVSTGKNGIYSGHLIGILMSNRRVVYSGGRICTEAPVLFLSLRTALLMMRNFGIQRCSVSFECWGLVRGLDLSLLYGTDCSIPCHVVSSPEERTGIFSPVQLMSLCRGQSGHSIQSKYGVHMDGKMSSVHDVVDLTCR